MRHRKLVDSSHNLTRDIPSINNFIYIIIIRLQILYTGTITYQAVGL